MKYHRELQRLLRGDLNLRSGNVEPLTFFGGERTDRSANNMLDVDHLPVALGEQIMRFRQRE